MGFIFFYFVIVIYYVGEIVFMFLVIERCLQLQVQFSFSIIFCVVSVVKEWGFYKQGQIGIESIINTY